MAERTPSALAGIPFKDLNLDLFLEIEGGKVWICRCLSAPPALNGYVNSSPGSLPVHQDAFSIMIGDVCSLILTPVPYSGQSIIALMTKLLSLPLVPERQPSGQFSVPLTTFLPRLSSYD